MIEGERGKMAGRGTGGGSSNYKKIEGRKYKKWEGGHISSVVEPPEKVRKSSGGEF